MGEYLQILALLVSGMVLVWFGYTLFFGPLSIFYPGGSGASVMGKHKARREEASDDNVCPVCSVRMHKNDRVKTTAVPNFAGNKDKLMFIRGCHSCLEHNTPRKCPVCGQDLTTRDYLVSRLFERPNNRNHVHVIGCNYCKKTAPAANLRYRVV
jgi:rubredoxin